MIKNKNTKKSIIKTCIFTLHCAFRKKGNEFNFSLNF